MPNNQSANGIEALGRSKSATAGDDGALLALETKLDDLVAQLLAAQEENGEIIVSSDPLPAVPENVSGYAFLDPLADGDILGDLVQHALRGAPFRRPFAA